MHYLISVPIEKEGRMTHVDGGDDPYLTAPQIARIIPCSRRQAYNLIHGKLRHLRLGTMLRVRRSVVEEYLLSLESEVPDAQN